jgi:predicted metal-dependent TIM-barrel fold hydrolase
LFKDFVDAHLDLTACSDLDLQNMAWFGQSGALVTVGRRQRFLHAEEAHRWWTGQGGAAARRLRRAGLEPWLAVGLTASQRPTRWHEDLWDVLAAALAEPDVAAVGPVTVSPREPTADTARRLLSLAAEFDLAALLVPHPGRNFADTQVLMDLAGSCGVPPSRVIVARTDYTTLRMVVRAGALACVSVGPDHLRADEAARMVQQFEPVVWRQLAVSSSAATGAVDVLAIPKLLRELTLAGLAPAMVRALKTENVRRWLTRGRVGEPASE